MALVMRGKLGCAWLEISEAKKNAIPGQLLYLVFPYSKELL